MTPQDTPCGAVSEARPPPGPRKHPPEWKGMGPPRCHCRTSYHHHHHPYHQYLHASITTSTHPLRLLLLLCLLYGFALASVSGFSLQQKSSCQIDQCYDQYKDALELVGGVGDVNPLGGGGGGVGEVSDSGDNEARCVALRTYWSCIKSTKNSSRGCQGNIHYYSVRNVLRNQMKQYNCTMHGPTVDPSSTSSSSSLSKQVPPPPRQVPDHCQYHGKKVFQHCGLFGDPHLRTFDNQFQTCKVKGAWPLVNNEYLIVQVTNDPVLGGQGDATATSKLTVIVKSNGECGSEHYHTYQAQTDSLPSAFEDGNTSIGPHGSVQVVEVEANRHIEIHVHYIATTIVVRQIGRYFTFAIHIPQSINENQHKGRSSGEPELCSKGCPASEQINYKQYLAQRRDTVTRIQSEATGPQVVISRYEAEEVCKDSGLVDFYFDSCVFDLMATGDKNFTLAALSALKDVLRLDPAMAPLENRTSLQPYDSAFGAATAFSRTVSWWWHVVCVVSLCLTLWQRGDVVVVR
ncbi:hypothetical protein V1264_001373 [Littorina saxatilis]|uniref:Repulsive guidance molecule A n=3 Tax=Littorina saxatilis TaxID=31220 RepID=A0AAN9C2H9_9CAEN